MAYFQHETLRIRAGKSRGQLFGVPSHNAWWTPERDAKLRYVMETYGDPDKAARVLGQPRHAVMRRWKWISRNDR